MKVLGNWDGNTNREAEIHVNKDYFLYLVKQSLCLPDSYRVWGIAEAHDHIAVLVESRDLPETEDNATIPLLTHDSICDLEDVLTLIASTHLKEFA